MGSLFDELADQVVGIQSVLGLWLVDAAGDIVSSRIRARHLEIPDLRLLQALARGCADLGATGSPVWFVVHGQNVQILVRWLDMHALLAAAEPHANLAMLRVGITAFDLKRNYPTLPPMMVTDVPEMTPTPTGYDILGLSSSPSKGPTGGTPRPSRPLAIPPVSQGPKPTEHPPEIRLELAPVARLLGDAIGPYAMVVVQRESQRICPGSSTLSDGQFRALITNCATYIDDPEDRAQFERDVGTVT